MDYLIINLWDVRGFDVVSVFTNTQKCTDFYLACGLEVRLIVKKCNLADL